jgi:hypothetical protein
MRVLIADRLPERCAEAMSDGHEVDVDPSLDADDLEERLDHDVLVILQYYAVYFLVAGAALRLADRVLLGAAVTALVVGPVVYLSASMRWPGAFVRDGTALSDPPAEIVRDLFLSGSYPVVTWSAPLLFGMWLGRRDLNDPRLRRWLVVIGASIGVASVVVAETLTAFGARIDEPASPWRLAAATPHSQMPLWLLGSSAAAAAVLGVSLWAADRWQQVVRPFVLTGQLALTVYVGHLLALHLAPGALRSDEVGEATLIVLAFAVAAIMVSVLWRARMPRGPLEMALRPPRKVRASL